MKIMKKILQLLILSLIAAISSCKKDENNTVVPKCIGQIIESTKANACPKNSKVSSYLFQKKIVYVFDFQSCVADGGIDVYSEKCEYIGLLGGFAGIEKINGVKFFENAKLIQVLWEN